MKTHFLLLLSVFFSLSVFSVSISPKYASLTARGKAVEFKVIKAPGDSVVLSYSPNLFMSEDKTWVNSIDVFDSKNTKAWIIAQDKKTLQADTCFISIVPWEANFSKLEITDYIADRYSIIGKDNDTLYVVYKSKLYKTEKGFKNLEYLSDFKLLSNEYHAEFIKTPYGSFIRNEREIYFSKDEKTWTLDFLAKGRGIRNSFGFSYDSISKIVRVFTHDYATTGLDTFPSNIYRKEISPDNPGKWEKVFTFYSKDQWANDKSLYPACRHIHTLAVDPYTNQIWFGSGDMNQHSHIYYSQDNGNTWKHIGVGTQEWRILSIWFTPEFVYWSMDTNVSPQSIFRVSRDIYKKNGFWPDMTPKITNGKSNRNLLYLILSKKEQDFSLGTNKGEVGEFVWGNSKALFNDSNTAIVVNDPIYDYREKVISLPNNALWSNIHVHDDRGDDVVLINTNAEGQAIDNRPRIFGFKERMDGTVDVQELISLNKASSVYSQMWPFEQDSEGYIYYQNMYLKDYLNYGVFRLKMDWEDNFYVKTGRVNISRKISKNNYVLKLNDYEGQVIKWQFAHKDLKWIDILPIVTADSMIIQCDSVNSSFYRAIVKTSGNPQVASVYIKLSPDNNTDINQIRPNRELFVRYDEQTNQIVINCNDSAVSQVSMAVYDITGKLVRTDSHDFSVSNKLDIGCYGLKSGVYIVKVFGNQMNKSFRVIIQ